MLAAAASAGTLAKPSVTSFTTGSYSTLRLQQLLAQLGYLPLNWTPSDPSTGTIAATDANAQLAAAYDAPAGSFAFQLRLPERADQPVVRRDRTTSWSAGRSARSRTTWASPWTATRARRSGPTC